MTARQLLPTMAALLLLGLAGCAPPAETPEQMAARQQESCRNSGFAPDSDSYRLCLLLQQTNEHLQRVESRLNTIENQIYRPYPYPYPGYRYW